MSSEQKSVNSKALKSGVWYFMSNVVMKAMTLITTPIFTRLMTKEEIGDYSNFLAWSHIAVILVTMKMEASLISAKFDYSGHLNQYNLSILSLTFCSTVVWVFMLYMLPEFFVGITGVSIAYLYYILIYCFFYAVVSYYQIAERFLYRYKNSVAIGLLVAISSAILSVYLVLTMDNRLTARVIGGIIPAVIAGFALIAYFMAKGRKVIFSTWPYALKICIPYVPHLLSLLILSSIDRVMITRFCGSADNALYSVAYSCGHMVVLIMVSMNSAFAPWLGDKLHNKEYDEIRKISRYYISVFCILFMPIMLLAPEVLLVMGGHDYLEAKYVIVPVALACVCQFLYTLFVNIEQYSKKTIGMAYASIAAAGLNYILNMFFIPRYGYISAAYTTFISYLFLLLIHMWLVRHIGMQKTYDYRFVLGIVILMVIIGLCISLLYENNILRIIVFACLLLGLSYAVWRKKTIILKIYRTIKR